MPTAFNISRDKIGYYAEQARDVTGASITVLLLQSTGLEADGVLADYDDLAALLAGTNDEATFTNYVRKSFSGTGVVRTVDDVNNRVLLGAAAPGTQFTFTWANAGGTTNNTLGKALLVYSPPSATDATRIPLTAHDMSASTDGNDLVVRLHADGFSRVTQV